jgi:molybdate transport system regulatory protein
LTERFGQLVFSTRLICLIEPGIRMSGKRLQLRPRFRVMSNETIALGPGKIDLLRLVAETGSIREAARKMGMSYMRAWTLVRTMNRCFTSDLILSARGGKAGGGAHLSPLGHRILELYTEIETSSMRAAAPAWRQIKNFLAR